MPARHKHGTTLIAASVGMMLGIQYGSCQEPTNTICAIDRVWNERQKRVVSAVFAWDEQLFLPKESVSFRVPDGTRLVLYPPEDATYDYKYQLKLDGGKLRTERSGPSLVQAARQFLPRRYVAVTDGVVSKSFFDGDGSGLNRYHPFGCVFRGSEHCEAQSIEFRAILLCYRPSGLNMGEEYDLRAYRVAGRHVALGGADCVLLIGGSDVGRKNLLWLDAGREFVPVRWQSFVDGCLRVQLDVQYKGHPSHGWYPASWTYIAYAPPQGSSAIGRVKLRGSARVTAYALNADIPDSEFRVDYPAGTLVSDLRAGEEYYIVREGGARRIVTEAELRAGCTYEQLLATNSGMAIRPAPGGGADWGACALLIACAGALVALLWRARLAASSHRRAGQLRR